MRFLLYLTYQVYHNHDYYQQLVAQYWHCYPQLLQTVLVVQMIVCCRYLYLEVCWRHYVIIRIFSYTKCICSRSLEEDNKLYDKLTKNSSLRMSLFRFAVINSWLLAKLLQLKFAPRKPHTGKQKSYKFHILCMSLCYTLML